MSYPGYGAKTVAMALDGSMAYICNGGFDNAASRVAPARTGEGEVFQQLAFLNASRHWEEPGQQSL
ncbi:MAG: hypothetical protein OXU66_08955 [Gammaproteobacteria bacterium]|nr:hypothetical protein [Gammaproteobacteria bacterium]MDD9896923.1 hypothetical protein [Gammaproteobacteria bacterium]MDD9959059.1 hypothetical protein [Gammaproteobacteria bacterium]